MRHSDGNPMKESCAKRSLIFSSLPLTDRPASGSPEFLPKSFGAYVMDDGFNKKFIEGGVWLTSSSFLIRAVGFLSVLIVLSSVSVKDYGLYKLVLAAFAFLTGFFFSGFDNLVISDLSRERGEGRMDRVGRLFLEYSRVKLLIGLILFLAVFFGADFIGRFVDPEVVQFLPLISILFIFYALERPLNFLFNTYLKFKYLALYTLVEEMGKLGLILIFVF